MAWARVTLGGGRMQPNMSDLEKLHRFESVVFTKQTTYKF